MKQLSNILVAAMGLMLLSCGGCFMIAILGTGSGAHRTPSHVAQSRPIRESEKQVADGFQLVGDPKVDEPRSWFHVPNVRPSSDSKVDDPRSSDPEVEKLFSKRYAEYQESVARWEQATAERKAAESELTAVKAALSEHKTTKPKAPTFTLRDWSTTDGKHTTSATLVDTDNETARLRKTNEKVVTVPKDKLIAGSRIYIQDAFDSLSEYRNDLAEWTDANRELLKRHSQAELTINDADAPRPSEPEMHAIASEIETEKKKARAERFRKKREQRKREAEAASKIAAKRAEEELDFNGLILMRKSVKGVGGKFSGKVTGVIVNRRARKLSYVQVSINLYDSGGAQVGSALANVTGLEPGRQWKFEAPTFVNFAEYKVSEVTGY